VESLKEFTRFPDFSDLKVTGLTVPVVIQSTSRSTCASLLKPLNDLGVLSNRHGFGCERCDRNHFDCLPLSGLQMAGLQSRITLLRLARTTGLEKQLKGYHNFRVIVQYQGCQIWSKLVLF
jgi:hypothetical protein